MKWCAIFGPLSDEYIIYHSIRWHTLLLVLAFKLVYFCLHLFYHCIPHIILLMKNRLICVSCTKHAISRSHESKNIVNLVPPQFIWNQFSHSCCFSNVIFSISRPLLTNDHVLKASSYEWNLLSMTNVEANHVSATRSNYKGQTSLNIANIMEWFLMKKRMKDASSAIFVIQYSSWQKYSIKSHIF